ncbi:hypothetical protein S245_015481, partial [Arachis hypogaea]|nr:uncharacterized protein LOC114927715 [Arachis hypogaea]
MDEDPNKKDKGKRLASEAEPSPEKDPKKPRPLMESSSIADNFQQVNEAEAAAESFAETTITYVVMDDPEEPEVESHERFQTRGEIMHNFTVGCQNIIEEAKRFNAK